LTIGAHVLSDPGHRLRPFCSEDGAKHLPACASEAESRNQAIPSGQESAIEPEEFKQDVRTALTHADIGRYAYTKIVGWVRHFMFRDIGRQREETSGGHGIDLARSAR
jgi:hypothetical protein